MASKKKAAKSPPERSKLMIERGGETFSIEEANGLFAVKRKDRRGQGNLDAARRHPETFGSVKFRPSESITDVDVYEVDAETRDEAMRILREESSDAQWCAHLYHMPNDPNGLMIPTDSIYVEIDATSDPDTVNQLLDQHGLELMPATDEQNHAFVLRLTSKSTQNPIKIANALRKSKAVKLAEPDFAVKAKSLAYRPIDSLFTVQWHLENTGGFAMTAGADVRAPEAWDITRGSRSIRVCVMDDGVQIDHPDFASPGKIVSPHDFGQNDADPSPVFTDDNHGTSCAGVAVADENGSGTVGIAPGCALMPYRTSGSISDTTITALFDKARVDGADVISCSWGVAAEFFALSTRMQRAINRAATEGRGGRGCVIVFASGNENRPVDGTDPATGRRVRSGFAIHPDVIAVNASNSRDVRSDYSNFGPETWVCAPSSGSGGRRIVTTDRTGSAGYQAGDYTTVNGFGGTSSACPLVAGICALMLSVNPGLTSAQVREILKDTADKIDPANGGYANGRSDLYGYGRVNAFAAVAKAKALLAPAATRRVTFESSPWLDIPDNSPAGVADSIRVEDAALVEAVEVAIEIEHTYRGDLVVELLDPAGNAVKLHDRTGLHEDNLVATYTTDNVAALASLTGRSAHGAWTLRVMDLANIDTGTLLGWRLTLALADGQRTEWRATPGEMIPDDVEAGITSSIEVGEVGQLFGIEVDVDISHSYRGDLRVALRAPDGTTATLHDRADGPADDLLRTFTQDDSSNLSNLVNANTEIQGTWTLQVSDHAARDVGKLNAWGLRLFTQATVTLMPQPSRRAHARQRLAEPVSS